MIGDVKDSVWFGISGPVAAEFWVACDPDVCPSKGSILCRFADPYFRPRDVNPEMASKVVI